MGRQTGILEGTPPHASFVELRLARDRTAEGVAELAMRHGWVLGLGMPLLRRLGRVPEQLEVYASMMAEDVPVPATQEDLIVRVHGDSPGHVFHQLRLLDQVLAPGDAVVREVPCFTFVDRERARDMSGYEDGTENPTGDKAEATAFARDGSSVMAVQLWEHDMAALDAMSGAEKNDCIGRDRDSNEELGDAPLSAHVKRTAQEDFDPEAFMLRRSMPWVDGRRTGLYFCCFAADCYPFRVQMRRMSGLEDHVRDGVFRFSRPETGAFYWCPPTDLEGRPRW